MTAAEQHHDGLSLLWRMHQRADEGILPAMRTIVHVILTGTGGAEGWLDIDRDGMTVCKTDQGKDVDLVVQADTGQMYKWLAGIASFRELLSSGHVRLIGPSRMARAFPTWFTPAPFGEELLRSSRRLQARPA